MNARTLVQATIHTSVKTAYSLHTSDRPPSANPDAAAPSAANMVANAAVFLISIMTPNVDAIRRLACETSGLSD